MVTKSSKKSNGLSPASSTSPTSSSNKSPSMEGETTAEFRRLVVQEQVRSLRRRLWHAFQNEDAATALRAYKATARDLQAWIREEIEQAKEREERRLQEEKEKKNAQKPSMMKKLTSSRNTSNSSGKKETNPSKPNRMSFRRRSTGEKPKESSLFTKMKKPPPNTQLLPISPTPLEAELIMSTANKEGNENPLLPLHMNPSEPFLLDDYKDPSYEIDPITGEARSVASINEPGSQSSSPTNQALTLPPQTSGRQFKSFRKRNKNRQQSQQPRTSFWASMKLGHRSSTTREAAAAAAAPMEAPEALGVMDPSESTSPDSAVSNPNDLQAIALTDPKMTTPLHEAARLGDAELVRLMLQHPWVEPNFKNGCKRTALHMVAGGWTEPEERLWRMLQQKLKAKLNHKKKLPGGLKTASVAQADIGISSPVPVEIDPNDGQDNGPNGSSGAKKAAKAMSRFFHTTFSNKTKDGKAGLKNSEASAEPQGYLVWDEQTWNQLKTERMDCLLAILTWSHPDDGTSSAGEGASVNAVDGQGRTALHYAAELGREDICMAVLSSFGAMLTVVDDQARTPCELAAEQNHPQLASQLEARALLYSDPYGMDDELLAAVMAEQQLPDDDELDVSESENIAVVKARMALSPPYLWYRTLNASHVEKERTKRLAECCKSMMQHVSAKEQENELKRVMYSMKVDEEADDQEEDEEGEADTKASGEHDDETAKEDADNSNGEASSEVDVDACEASKKAEKKEEGETSADDTAGEEKAAMSQDINGSADSSSDTNESKIATTAGPEPNKKKAPGKPKDDLPKQSASTNDLETAESSGLSADKVGDKDDKTLSDDDVLALKSIQTANIAQYLSSHGWIVEKALAAFKQRPVKALEEAGIPLQAIHRAKQRSQSKSENINDDSISNNMCLICFDDFDIADGDNWTHLVNCSHSFCKSCLGEYLADCAQTRSTGLCVPCPHHECVIPMSQPEIRALSPTPATFTMLQKTANDNFVSAASDLRFCPHPGCEGIAKATISPIMKKWGIDFEQLQFTGAVCTAVHKQGEEPQFQVCGHGPPPITYEGVVDLSTTRARSTTPPMNAHRFCFGCGESKHHFPVTCEVLEQWKSKMEAEVEQLKEDGDGPEGDEAYGDIAQRLWMRANTRPCPKCKAPIEKNEGCNHMTCFNPQCKHEFCWICRKDWKLHNTATGGFFRCNRWQDEDKHDFYDAPPPPDQLPAAADATNDEVMNNPEVMAQTYGTAMHETRIAWKKAKEMKRFLHHYTRWNAHMESAALEKMMSENVCIRLAPVVEAAVEYTCDPQFNFDGKGLSFVHAAFKELLECRSVLQHSYAYSFFKFESLAMKRVRHGKRLWNEKAAFEQMQSELEIVTEQMSDIVARSHLRATQTQILFLTVGASERRNEFSNLIFTLINEEKKRKQTSASRSARIASQLTAAAPNMQQLTHAANTLSIQGVAPQVHGARNQQGDLSESQAHQEQQQQLQATQETVREALLASLEAFMANTEGQPTFVAQANVNSDVDDFEEDEEEEDEDDEHFTSWACPACTYMNSGGSRCAMCNTTNF